MKFTVATPISVVVDADEVTHVRAEDETGTFGILPGHADFITALPVSVITWRSLDGRERHVAVRSGILTVRDGTTVSVATRQAIGDDTLGGLDMAVLERFRQEEEVEATARTSASRLQLATIRQVQRYLQAGRSAVPQGIPGSLARSQGETLPESDLA